MAYTPQALLRILLAVALTLAGTLAMESVQMPTGLLPPLLGLAYEIALGIVVFLLWWRWQGAAIRSALPREAASIRVVVMTGLCASFTALAHGYWTPLSPKVQIETMIGSSWGVATVLIMAIVVAPMLEEALFRGFLLGRLRGDLGSTGSVLLSAVFFAGVHDDRSRWVTQLAAGIMFGAIVVCTGRLWLAALAHGAVNAGGIVDFAVRQLGAPERLGILFPTLCVTAAAIAALELRRVLLGTRWDVTPSSASRVAAPATWGLDGAG